MSGSIDVHAHYLPPAYRDALVAQGHEEPDGFVHIPEWSAVEHVGMMDRLDIECSMLSVSSPGVHLADDAPTAELARMVNEEGHRAVVDHPGRFGLLASLPLPDIDATMREIDHAFDVVDADGVVLLTNVDGVYPGDDLLAPVFAELDRRRARVFLHPTSPACWHATSLGRPRPMIEFLFDTTRCVADLILGGVVARHPGIEFIVPHAGATLPMVADRIAVFSMLLETDQEVDVMRDLGRLHYDLAGYPIPRQLDALRSLTPATHLHYGSDYPFTPEFAAAAGRARLHELDDGRLLTALRDNTRALFPRFTT